MTAKPVCPALRIAAAACAFLAFSALLSLSNNASAIFDAGSVVIDHHGVEPDSHSNGFTFNPSDRWSSTATNGGGLTQGDPTTLTWGILPDGTSISNHGVPSVESTDPSNLVAYLDGKWGYVGGGPITARPWYSVFSGAFDRIAELSGLSYAYEPNDDGNANGGIDNTSFPTGVLGVRPDVRIGGHSIDGSSRVLAYNYFPNHGDMVLDTDENSFYSTNSVAFRNILMHEHGHGLGIAHVEPVNQTKLMEPFLSTQFEGPQVDDIQAIHRGYGDFYEKSNSGAGNDVFGNATPLGGLSIGSTLSIGADAADPGLSIEVFPGESDFISIDDNSDVDYLSFSLSGTALVDLTLTPLGPTYLSGPQNNVNGDEPSFNSSAQSDLTVVLFSTDGVTPLAIGNAMGLGGTENIPAQVLGAGTYFARVTGAHNTVQLYQLDVSAAVVPEPAAAGLALLGFLATIRRRR